ncbi:phosphoglycerate dehydrogenase [Thermovibrio ammonificans]|jgi:D-3-phosphoglycerate dehydrogenase|uniref:D-3-phosphoglycerate dehydrogenase n=1 Tax=Thermovibrio ammonificans (strain DSM 15698 / JCM 12110 / HB-1) TaxID=648996 RepID=E8T4L3_THEA1|nr:phosphoglycerate dehydrogenase [Thermovibrio ammonificans]ADU97471.1 D-3-phosphoglycerate dehydrogenase [Thermovibrio ammonificans HB-1]
MGKFKVLVTEHIADAGIELLKSQPDVELTYDPELFRNFDRILQIIPEYDALITRSGTPVTEELLERAKRLKVVGRAGVGVDNIDLEAASRRGILVVNAPTGNTLAATEHTMGMMIAAARLIPYAHKSLKEERKWERKKFMGVELAGKTLGIIGFGRIGSRVGIRAKAFDMKVIAYDPYIKREKAERLGVELVDDLDELLKRSDIITVHTPLTDETRNMITKREIEKMKDGVILLNIARGGIINEKDLYEALVSGKVRAAAVDVFSKEPATDNILLDAPNIVVTPHIGANTFESQTNVAVIIANQVLAALRGEEVEFAVNAPFEDTTAAKNLKPYMELAEKLGLFAVQVACSRSKEIVLEFRGELGEEVKPITTAFLKGYLQKVVDIPVNLINAPFLAKEKGISVVEVRRPEGVNFKKLVRVICRGENGEEFSIAGTVMDEKFPKIVEINGFLFDLTPEGKLLLIKNYDVPGVIGKLGSILGKHRVNIAGFQLGRKEKGKEAKGVILIDDDVPQQAIEEIKEIPEILEVKQVNL